MATSYQIIELYRDGSLQPMDGDTYHTKAALFAALPYADLDAMVIAIDFAECREGGSTPCRDVTEDMTLECWSRLNRTEREELAEKGYFNLASRFVADEYSAAVRSVEAIELARTKGQRSMKTFYLARRSDGHRFEGAKIKAYSVKHAEEVYTRLKFNLANLIIVGAKQ